MLSKLQKAVFVVLALRRFYAAQDSIRGSKYSVAEEQLRRSIHWGGWLVVHPHILLVVVLSRLGRQDEALRERNEIDDYLASTSKYNTSTRQYVSYYTYGAIPFDYIIANEPGDRMPNPEMIDLQTVDKSIARHFSMEIRSGWRQLDRFAVDPHRRTP